MTDAKGDVLVVDVIPIMRGITKPKLSYFTTRQLTPGEFVRVPVKNGSTVALVERVHQATGAKTEIKRSAYALRKLSKNGEDDEESKKTKESEEKRADKPAVKIPEAFMAAARTIAAYYATTLGSTLSSLIPKILLSEPELVFGGERRELRRAPGEPRHEPLLLQMESEERLAQYRGIIRESLAKNSSTMLVAPTDEEARRVFDFLAHGIEEYAYLFSLSKKPKELKKILRDARGSEHPVLFVTTPAGLAFDRPDLDTIIVERENSAGYRSMSRPWISAKHFLRELARESKRKIILGDSVLSTETLWRERNGDYRELLPLKWRLSSGATHSLVDMKSESKPLTLGEGGFEILSLELQNLIAKALSEKSPILLFGARKGLAPTTVCGDCGSVLSCKNCGAPVVLHESETGNIYVCHACSAKRSPKTGCDICGSWRLAALGIGVTRIAQAVKKLFPEARVMILDKDHVTTPAQARKTVREFVDRGGVLVGTELALLYTENVPYAGLVSADALFSIPDFSIHERVFYLVSRLREIAKKELVIQTRNIGKKVLGWAASGNILEFYKSEIAEREELSYPPVSIFVKVAFSTKAKDTEEKKDSLKQTFGKWRPEFVEGKASIAMILRIERARWPVEEIIEALSLLSPEFSIKVDPESILL